MGCWVRPQVPSTRDDSFETGLQVWCVQARARVGAASRLIYVSVPVHGRIEIHSILPTAKRPARPTGRRQKAGAARPDKAPRRAKICRRPPRAPDPPPVRPQCESDTASRSDSSNPEIFAPNGYIFAISWRICKTSRIPAHSLRPPPPPGTPRARADRRAGPAHRRPA